MLMADPKEKLLRINVGGKPYEFDRKSLAMNKRGTFLEKFASWSHEEREKLADFCLEKPNRYFFWKNAIIFDSVVHYIATGHIHCPEGVSMREFIKELRFWAIGLHRFPVCCIDKLGVTESERNRYVDEIATSVAAQNVDETSKKSTQEDGGLRDPSEDTLAQSKIEEKRDSDAKEVDSEADEFTGVCCGEKRRFLWIILEEPHSDIVAKAVMAVSTGFVVVSIILMILGSMKQLQDEDKEPIEPIMRAEQVCVAWFTLEYIFRLLITPLRWKFIKTPINIVDALSLFPFYLELFFLVVGKETSEDLQNWKGALLAMRVLRVLRVARVLKLARYSGGLTSFGTTLTSSKKEIGMLLMFLSTAMLLFSTSVYFFEKEYDETPFTSIPATFWWAVTTMTTVGYGDMIPVSVGGKLVAGFATISGCIVLSFPITLIVEKFNQNYQLHGAEDGGNKPIDTLHVRSVAIV